MTNNVDVRAPAEQTEGTRSQILRWLKTVGEAVTENEPLIEIETDKVTVEVASPGTGTLREILKQEQDEIAPGDLLGTIASTTVGNVSTAGDILPSAGDSSAILDGNSSTKVGVRPGLASTPPASLGAGQAAG